MSYSIEPHAAPDQPTAMEGVEVNPELWTTDMVADALKCNPQEVRKLIRQGRLRARRWGKTYRVEPVAVAEFIDQMEAA